MNKNNIIHQSVIRQCLSLLPTETFSCPLLNYDQKKLTADSLIKIFVAAQLGKWESYADIEEKLRADKELLKSLNLESISGSQLSRRINEITYRMGTISLFSGSWPDSRVNETVSRVTKRNRSISHCRLHLS